jgi:hypothetical protein
MSSDRVGTPGHARNANSCLLLGPCDDKFSGRCFLDVACEVKIVVRTHGVVESKYG